jgi:hypothetical protein
LIDRKIVVNVDFGNYAFINGYDYGLIVAMATKSGTMENITSSYIGSSVEEIYAQLPFNPNPTGDSNYVDIDGIRYYAYWIPVLPPRSQTTFTYLVDSKEPDTLFTQAFLYEQPLSTFQLRQDIEYIGQSATVGKVLQNLFEIRPGLDVENTVEPGTKSMMSASASAGGFDCNNIDIKKVEKLIAKDVKKLAEQIHGGAKAYKGAEGMQDVVRMTIENKKKAFVKAAKGTVDVRSNTKKEIKKLTKEQFNKWVKKEDRSLGISDLLKRLVNANDPIQNAEKVLTPNKQPFEDLIKNTFDCLNPEEVATKYQKCYLWKEDKTTGDYYFSRTNTKGCTYPGGDGSGKSGQSLRDRFVTWILSAFDPNMIQGPEGITELRMINRSDPLNYTILFENKPEATAPARFVSINNELPDGLRPQSFVLTEFGFGDTIIKVEPTNRLTLRIPLGKKYNSQILDLVAGIDAVNNRAFWRFSTIDPETSNLTQDPLNGFLPPNDSTGIGEGFVRYEISLDPAVEGGSEILNQAEIIFDRNEIIPTNIWSNVVANADPQSRVNELPDTSSLNFSISWEGSSGDMSAGILGYDIYVSENDRPYELFLENTLATRALFTGVHGSVYKFFSVLQTIDGVTEIVPDQADAVTRVDTSFVDTTVTSSALIRGLPDDGHGSAFYSKVYPNPVSGRLWIDYASESDIDLSIYDLNGRRLHSEMLNPSSIVTSIQVDISRFPGGILILQLNDKEHSKIERIVKLE